MERTGITYNKALIKQLFTIGRYELDAYRYYIIARAHYAHGAGAFSLNEFMDLLHDNYNFKTLHHKPGNNRSKYRAKLTELFDKSVLFEPYGKAGIYRIVSQRRFKDTRRTTNREVCKADLLSKRAFNDAVIGMILDGAKYKTMKSVAEYTGLTERRIQQATRRNHERGRWIKTNNLVLVKTFDTYTAVQRHRKLLVDEHGVGTPKPIKSRYRGRTQWHLVFYEANSYSHRDVEESRDNSCLPRWKRERFRKIKEVERKLFDTTANLIEFTASHFADDYVMAKSCA